MPYQPPAVPVVITTSEGITLKYRRAGMRAELAPGHVVELREGPNHFQLPPGQHRIQMWSQYAWRVGHATLDIDTTRGPVQLFYAAPHTLYSPGAAGFTPQDRPGRRVQVAIYAFAFLVPVLAILIALLLR